MPSARSEGHARTAATCTRACAFCNVKTGMPRMVDPKEPKHVADVAVQMGLKHIVITSVDRDDLPDGGARQFVKVIEALRAQQESVRDKLDDLRDAGDGAWEDIKLGVEKAWTDLSDSTNKALSRF